MVANINPWYERQPAYNRKHKYGITDEEYDSLLIKQVARCAICNEHVKLCVDHDHNTGKVRGLLCNTCNAGLGMFKDSIRLLAGAIVYLQDHEDQE